MLVPLHQTPVVQGVAQGAVERDGRLPSGEPAEFGGVAPICADLHGVRPGRIDLDRDRDAAHGQQELDHLAQRGGLAGAQVIDLARTPLLDGQAVGPHHVPHVGEVAAGIQVADAEGWGLPTGLHAGHCRAKLGMANVGSWRGPVWLKGRTRTTGNPRLRKYWRPSRSCPTFDTPYGVSGRRGASSVMARSPWSGCSPYSSPEPTTSKAGGVFRALAAASTLAWQPRL